MTAQKPPSSAHERQTLIAKRKSETPAPAPAPKPKGIEASHAERVAQWERHKRSFNREKRIQEIDRAMNKTRGIAKTGFDRAR